MLPQDEIVASSPNLTVTGRLQQYSVLTIVQPFNQLFRISVNYSILQFNLIFTYSTPHSTIQLLIQPLFNYSTPYSIIRHSIQLFNLSFNYSTSHSTIQPHIQLFNLLFTPYSTLQSFHSDIQTKVSVPSTLEAIQRQTSRALLTGRYFFLIFLVLTLNSC